MYIMILKIIYVKSSNFIKLRTRTLNEIEEEDDIEENEEKEKSVSSADENEDEGPIYNPKNLPLGWDGKPIRKFFFYN